MSGPIKQFGNWAGGIFKEKAPASETATPTPAAPKTATSASTSDEAATRRRIARRGSRVLLSEARIAPETGLQQTLGSGM